jgi:hypothetical protein
MKHKQMMGQGLFDLVLGRIQKTFGKKFEVENVASNTSIMIANIHNLFPIEATEHEVVLNNNDELEEDVNISVTVYRLNSSCESQEIFLQVTIQTEDIEGYIYHHYSFEQVQKEIEDTIDGNSCYVYNLVAENSSDIEEPKMYSDFKWLPNTLTRQELLDELNDFAEKSTGYVILEEILPDESCFRIIRLKDYAIKLAKPFNVEKTVSMEGVWLSAIINKCGFNSFNNSYYAFNYWKHELLNQGTSNYIIYDITEEVYKTLTWKLYEILESVEHGNENAKKDFYNNLLVEFNLYNRDFVSNPFVTKSEYFTENDKVISFTPDPEEIEFMKQAVVDSEDTPNAEPPLIASVEIPGGLKDEMNYLMFDTEHIHSLCDDLNNAYEKGVRYFLFENIPHTFPITDRPAYKLVKLYSDYGYTEEGLKIPHFTLFVDGTVGETFIKINAEEIITVVLVKSESLLDSKRIVIVENNNTLSSGAFVKPLTEKGYVFYQSIVNKYRNSIKDLTLTFGKNSRASLTLEENSLMLINNSEFKNNYEPEAPEDLSMFIKLEENEQ